MTIRRASWLLGALIAVVVATPTASGHAFSGTRSGATQQRLRSCGDRSIHRGDYVQTVKVADVQCAAGWRLSSAFESALAHHRLPKGALSGWRAIGRCHCYGTFGARFRLRAFTCRAAPVGLAGSEHVVDCRRGRQRVKIERI